jgi:uncharacterized protein with HEPN domain
MPHRPEALLEDILDAADFVREAARGKTLDNYRQDRMLRQAVERNFEIIGEAMNRMLKVAPKLYEEIDHAALIVGFRNALIHGYDLIDDERVWKTIQDDVPALSARISELLNSMNPNN